MSRSTPASAFVGQMRRRGRHHGRRPRAPDGSAASGAAGDGRLPRLAMRLLHARLRDGAVRAATTRRRRGRVDRDAVNDWLAGNLCRCTGYRPIVDAALSACTRRRAATASADERPLQTRARARSETDADDVFVGTKERFFAAPRQHRRAGRRSVLEHPDATLVAGATDVGLWVTKQLRDLPTIICLGRVARLRRDRGRAGRDHDRRRR